MATAQCPYCNNVIELDQKYNFCLNCEKQVRCRSCGELLLPNKAFCFVCGESLISSNHQSIINRFYSKEERNPSSASREIDFTFTDNAVEKAVPLFASQLSPSRIDFEGPLIQSTPPLPPALTDGGDEQAEENSKGTSQEDRKVSTEEPEKLDPRSLFVVNENGFLLAQHNDFKGQSIKQQQERFIILYVWAYPELTEQFTPVKGHISKAAKLNSLPDDNFRNYLSNVSRRYFNNISGSYQLKSTALSEVRKIYAEMKDDSINGTRYWEGSKSRGKTSRPGKDELKVVDEWVQRQTSTTGVDVRNLKLVELCMLALYEISKILGVQEAVKPGVAFDYVKKRYKKVEFTKDQFVRTCSREEYKDRFRRTDDGHYYLTPKAERMVEEILSSGNAINAEDIPA